MLDHKGLLAVILDQLAQGIGDQLVIVDHLDTLVVGDTLDQLAMLDHRDQLVVILDHEEDLQDLDILSAQQLLK
jgi:hypothetical protein